MTHWGRVDLGKAVCDRKHGLIGLLAALALLAFPSGALADGKLQQPRTVSDLGTFDGITYRAYSGFFVGKTSTGNYRVPYEVAGPAQPTLGNGTVLVEPPHFAIGTGVRDWWLGRDFLFGRRFSYGAVGWSTATLDGEVTNRILDSSARGVFIHGGGPLPGEDGRTDDEIIVDFARALGSDRVARRLLGSVDRRYLTGVSDSSETVKRIVDSGLADGLFDLVLLITSPTDQPFDPQDALAAGRYHGKVITVDSEFEWFSARGAEDRGGSPGLYRSYFVPGSPHVPDPLCPLFSNETTPASWQPELRARYVQGDAWVKTGASPPPSTRLATTSSGDIDRDSNGNALLEDITGQPVPRLPFIELGEATFVTGFPLGTYQPQPPPPIQQLGYSTHAQYLAAFDGAVGDQLSAGSLLPADAQALRDRARLAPPATYTENYFARYEDFRSNEPCP
jgi:Alpha/beta hydrolase domain